MYTEACEATNVRGEQSAEVLDLRMSCLADRLSGVKALTRILARADGQVVDHAVEAAGALKTLEPCADARLLRNVLPPPDKPSTRAEVARIRAGIAEAKALDDAGDERRARQALETLVAEARRVGYPPALGEALLKLCEIRAASGERNDALARSFKEVVWLAEASRDDELKAEAATFLVVVTASSDRFAESDDWAREAAAILQRIGGHDRLRAWLEMHVGVSLRLQGRNAEALVHDERAIAIKQAAGESPGQIARSRNNRALTLNELGRFEEALVALDRAIADLGAESGKEHPIVATFVSNKGETLDRLGRHAAARVAYQQALAIEERAYGSNSLAVAYPLTGLGESFLADGHPGEARPPLERAARIRQGQEGDGAAVAETNFALARALRGSNADPARAEKLAVSAERTYAGMPAFVPKAKEIAAWLAERPAPTSGQ